VRPYLRFILISSSHLRLGLPSDVATIFTYSPPPRIDEGVIKIFRTGHLERELQMLQFFGTRCSCTAILWVSIVSFAAITLCVASERVVYYYYYCCCFSYRLSPETFGYTLVHFNLPSHLLLLDLRTIWHLVKSTIYELKCCSHSGVKRHSSECLQFVSASTSSQIGSVKEQGTGLFPLQFEPPCLMCADIYITKRLFYDTLPPPHQKGDVSEEETCFRKNVKI
jgi:hypothetical protein